MHDINKTLEALRSLIKDPENLEKAVEHVKREHGKKLKNMERVKKLYSDDKSFEELLNRLILKHDDRWSEVCYHNGIQPYPWNILQSIVEVASEEGKAVDPVDDLTQHFPSELYEYRGIVFAITFGQGTVLSIYKNKELIYRD